MYEFRDTISPAVDASLPAEALQMNDFYIEDLIEGYRTLYVQGREALSPEISTYEVGVRDGSQIQSKRYPARIIVVGYQLIAKSNSAFREAYNKLGRILNVEEAQLIFRDEPDKFYIGTPSRIKEVEPGKNAVKGEFEILCADPFKYSVEEFEIEPTPVTEEQMAEPFNPQDPDNPNDNYVVPPSGWYTSQTLENVPTGSITLVGDGSSEYSEGVDWMFDSATNAIYMKENLANDIMDSWDFKMQSGLVDLKYPVCLIDYKGTYKSYPTLIATMPPGEDDGEGGKTGDDNGYIAFINDQKKILQFGNPDEEDEDVVSSKSVTSFSSDFQANKSNMSGWTTGQGMVWAFSKIAGSFQIAKVNGIRRVKVKSYGSAGANEFVGPCMIHSVKKDPAGNLGARNWTLTVGMLMEMSSGKNSQKEQGRVCIYGIQNTNGVRKIVAGVYISKGSSANKTARIHHVVNTKEIAGINTDINVERFNLRFGTTKQIVTKVNVAKKGQKAKYQNKVSYTKPVQSLTITKKGAAVTFDIAGIKHTYTDQNISNMEVNEVMIALTKRQGAPALLTHCLKWVKLVNDSYETTGDVKNSFSADDILEVDTEDGTVLLNSLEKPSLGALGNDWEEFYLFPRADENSEPVANTIAMTYSDWCETKPTLKVRYREVYL